jgi:SPP1 family predicted phage head-tail adaptor
MTISAGELDRRITIERATKTRDKANDEIDGWVSEFRLWASKRDYSSRENVGTSQVVREADTLFTIRWSKAARAIAPESHRVMYQGSIYEIVGCIEAADRQDGINILCAARPDVTGARGRTSTSDGAP